MSERDQYPAGVPRWVETLQPQPQAAIDFYGPLFGWDLSEAQPMPGGMPGDYFVARVDGRRVAGVGTLPDLGGPPMAAWNTYVGVDRVERSVDRVNAAGGHVLIGPLDGVPSGQLAVLADPTGAAISICEADARPRARLVSEPGAWAMSSLHTTDVSSAAAFYEAVFGWQPQTVGAPEAPLTLFRLPGYVGGEPGQPMPRDVVAAMAPASDPDAEPAVPTHWNVNFQVADADAFARHASDLGATIILPPTDAPGFRNAVLMDPQGAAFSVSQPTGGSPA
jgi:predicted enzyme related to lactoylglutathione lyase